MVGETKKRKKNAERSSRMGRRGTMAWTMAVLVAALACGCATRGKGPSDEELIDGVLAAWKAAFESQDLDKIMDAYSEDFQGERSADKEAVREFLGRAIDEGYLDGAELVLDEAEKSIEGDTATVEPVELSGDYGSIDLGLTLKKEADGKWRIVASDRY